MPYWGRMAGFGSAPQQKAASGVQGLISPGGFPHLLIPNPMGIIFYGFDTGTGVYTVLQDCSPGHTFDPPTTIGGGAPNIYVNTSSMTPFDPDPALLTFGPTVGGPAMTWPGTLQKPGIGSIIGGQAFDGGGGPGGTPLRDAINLQAAGAGAAFTMFCTFIQTANNGGNALLCGRGSALDFTFAVCSLALSPTNLGFNWSTVNQPPASQIPDNLYMSGSVSLNAVHTAVATCVNTAPGFTSVFLYLDGVLQTSAVNKTLSDVSYNNCQQEDQINVATYFHVYAGQSDIGLVGSVYQYGIGTQFWSATDVANFSANPYQFLSP